MKYLLLFLGLGLLGQLPAQDSCACCTADHGKFDFWVGEWEVQDTLGQVIGQNTIQKLEDNCILSENWRGAKGTTGRSYNYYDPTDSTWNQLWLDNSGTILKLKGYPATHQMVLKSTLLPGQKVDFFRHRITWTLNEDQTVTQQWDVVDQEDKLLQTVFVGIYHRKEE